MYGTRVTDRKPGDRQAWLSPGLEGCGRHSVPRQNGHECRVHRIGRGRKTNSRESGPSTAEDWRQHTRRQRGRCRRRAAKESWPPVQSNQTATNADYRGSGREAKKKPGDKGGQTTVTGQSGLWPVKPHFQTTPDRGAEANFGRVVRDRTSAQASTNATSTHRSTTSGSSKRKTRQQRQRVRCSLTI